MSLLKSTLKTFDEALEVEQKYSYPLSLTSVLDGVGDQYPPPPVLPAGKRPGIHCTRDGVGSRIGQDRCGESYTKWDLIRGLFGS